MNNKSLLIFFLFIILAQSVIAAPSKVTWTITIPPNPEEGTAFTVQVDAACSSGTTSCIGTMDLKQDITAGGCGASSVLLSSCGSTLQGTGTTDLLTGQGCTLTNSDFDTVSYSCLAGESGSLTFDLFACSGSSANTYELATSTSASAGGSIASKQCSLIVDAPVSNAKTDWTYNLVVNTTTGTDDDVLRFNATGTDDDGDQYRMTVCDSNAINDAYPGTCNGGVMLCTSPATDSASETACTLTLADSHVGTLDAYAFLCDAGTSTCSTSTTTSITVSSNPPTITAGPTDSPDPVNTSSDVTYTATGTDIDGNQYILSICTANTITDGYPGACAGGGDSLCNSTATNSGVPTNCAYTALETDIPTLSAYAFVCDEHSECSAASSLMTTTVNSTPPYWDDNLVGTPGNLVVGNIINYSANATDPAAPPDSYRLTVCRTNIINEGFPGTCDTGPDLVCNSTSVSSGSEASCLYTTVPSDVGTLTVYGFLCDSHKECNSTSTSNTTTITSRPPYTSVSLTDNPDPINVGSGLTYAATAIDLEGDKYRMTVCTTDAITPDYPGTCNGGVQVCVSAETNSGAEATCVNTTIDSMDGPSFDAYAFMCDNNSVCNSTSTTNTTEIHSLPPTWTDNLADAPDTVSVGDTITYAANASDPEENNYNLTVCSSNSFTGVSCDDTTLCTAASIADDAEASCGYVSLAADTGVLNAYGFLCDLKEECTSSTSETTTVESNPPYFDVPLSDFPASVVAGSDLEFNATATDPEGNVYSLTVCKTNEINEVADSPGTCAAGQTMCTNSSTVSGSESSCINTTIPADIGTFDTYGFLCDSFGECNATASVQEVTITSRPPYFSVALGDAPDQLTVGADITYTATAVDLDGDDYSLTVCKTNSITNGYPGTCAAGQTVCTDASTLSGSEATCVNTTVDSMDVPAGFVAFAFVCDDRSTCNSTSTSETTTVNSSDPIWSIDLAGSPDPQNVSSNIQYSGQATDPEGGQYFLTVCSDATFTAGGAGNAANCGATEFCTSAATNSGVTATCNYPPTDANVGSLDAYGIICDLKDECNATTRTTSTDVESNPPYFSVAFTDDLDPIDAGDTITYSATGTDDEGNQYKLVVCTTDSIIEPGTCGVGTLCTSILRNSGVEATCTNTTNPSDTSIVAFGFLCDSHGECNATSQFETTTVDNNKADWSVNLADSPDPVFIRRNITYTGTATDFDGDNYSLTVCKDDSILDGYPGTCNGGPTLCTSDNFIQGTEASCEYNTTIADAETTITAYGFICDEGSSTCNTSTTITTKVNTTAPIWIVNLAEDIDPGYTGSTLTWTGTANQPSGGKYIMVVCNSSSINHGYPGTCGDTNYCTSTATNDDAEASCGYLVTSSDAGTLNAYGFLCSEDGICNMTATSTSTTIISGAPAWSENLTAGPDPVNSSATIRYNATGDDLTGDHYRLTVCRTNAITDGYPGTCAASQTLCTSGATIDESRATCTYSTSMDDIGSLVAYGFICDAGSEMCNATSTNKTTTVLNNLPNFGCTFKTSCTGEEVEVLRAENETAGYYGGHVQLISYSGTAYTYVLCCDSEAGYELNATCSNSTTISFLNASGTTNAHTEYPNGAAYTNSICLGTTEGNFTCEYGVSSCSGSYKPALAMASSEGDNTTNAHVSNYSVYAENICCRLNDTLGASDTPPIDTVTLLYPVDGNLTVFERLVNLNWTPATETQGDPITYNVSLNTSGTCAVEHQKPGISDSNFTTNELCVDQNYDWSVQACDDDGCTAWETIFNFTIESNLGILLRQNTSTFATLLPQETNDTEAGPGVPMWVENIGNVMVNVSLNATGPLFIVAGLDNTAFQFKVVANESSSYASGQTSYANVPSALIDAFVDLKYQDANDDGLIHYKVTVPADEPAGTRSTIITVRTTVSEI